jgi:hypothetical protein
MDADFSKRRSMDADMQSSESASARYLAYDENPLNDITGDHPLPLGAGGPSILTVNLELGKHDSYMRIPYLLIFNRPLLSQPGPCR